MPEKAYAVFKKAERKRDLSKFLEAIPLYLEADRLANDRELSASCAISLGDTFRMVGEFTKAAAHYRRARRIFLTAKSAQATDAEVGLGLSLRALGSITEALSIFNGCLKTYKKADDRGGVAFTLWARAGALRIKGDLKGAIAGFNESKALFTRLRSTSGVGYCLTGLGGASRVAGRHQDSFKYYRAANKVFRETKDTFGIAYSYCGIANSLRMRREFKSSLEYFRMARRNYKKIGDKVSYAYTLWGEGTALQMLGRDTAALTDFNEAERLFKETKDRRGLLYCMLSKGELVFKKDPSKGRRAFNTALGKASALGLKVEAGYAQAMIEAAKKGPGALPLNIA